MQLMKTGFVLCLLWMPTILAKAHLYSVPTPVEKSFDVADVSKANIYMRLETKDNKSLYTLQCHTAGYTGDSAFEYSGDFECRLSFSDKPNTYSTLLTEDLRQARDWESRGRFFAADLRGACADIPEFGRVRSFRLKGMRLTLRIVDPIFRGDQLLSLKFVVTVAPDPNAHRVIAETVPLPLRLVPAGCKLREHFVDSVKMAKEY